jgi:hypothetical protein
MIFMAVRFLMADFSHPRRSRSLESRRLRSSSRWTQGHQCNEPGHWELVNNLQLLRGPGDTEPVGKVPSPGLALVTHRRHHIPRTIAPAAAPDDSLAAIT